MAQLSIHESEAVCPLPVVGGRLKRDPSQKGHYNFLPSQSDQGWRDCDNQTLGIWVALLQNHFYVFRSIKIIIQKHTKKWIQYRRWSKSISRPPLVHQLCLIQILESAPNMIALCFECLISLCALWCLLQLLLMVAQKPLTSTAYGWPFVTIQELHLQFVSKRRIKLQIQTTAWRNSNPKLSHFNGMSDQRELNGGRNFFWVLRGYGTFMFARNQFTPNG